jgi:hypothetical protein
MSNVRASGVFWTARSPLPSRLRFMTRQTAKDVVGRRRLLQFVGASSVSRSGVLAWCRVLVLIPSSLSVVPHERRPVPLVRVTHSSFSPWKGNHLRRRQRPLGVVLAPRSTRRYTCRDPFFHAPDASVPTRFFIYPNSFSELAF